MDTVLPAGMLVHIRRQLVEGTETRMQQEKKGKAVADWLSHADGQKEARGQEVWTQVVH